MEHSVFDKKDVRILWGYNEKSKIYCFKVAQFNKEPFPMHLYAKDARCNYRLTSDIGNCNSDWDKYTIAEILWKFFVENEFDNKEIRLQAINELCMIKEFYNEVFNRRIEYEKKLFGE